MRFPLYKKEENLEKSVKRLIMNDGSFSQYSTNYHRLLIDTLSLVELWREWLSADYFSKSLFKKCQLASSWLLKFVNTNNGQCQILVETMVLFCYQLHNLEYYNFKPSIQLSHLVFFKKYLLKMVHGMNLSIG